MSIQLIGDLVFILMAALVIWAILANSKYGQRADKRGQEMRDAFIEYLRHLQEDDNEDDSDDSATST